MLCHTLVKNNAYLCCFEECGSDGVILQRLFADGALRRVVLTCCPQKTCALQSVSQLLHKPYLRRATALLQRHYQLVYKSSANVSSANSQV